MPLYKFSPIKNKKQLVKAVRYVIKQASKLCENVTGKKLKIRYVTVFSHYENEYKNLAKILRKLGEIREANNGVRATLKEPIEGVTELRIRKPDPYRMHAGCCDFLADYWTFKEKYAHAKSKNLRLIKRQDYDMIEFFDPDFDVLAYVVSKQI